MAAMNCRPRCTRTDSMTTQLHPSAVIEEGADLGADTVVWAQTQIRRGASIGDACVIGRNVFIDADVVVGARCKVQNNALLYAPARIADGVFIGPGVVLTNDRFPRAVNPDGSLKSAEDWTSVGVTIEEGASVGAGATVLGGLTIGAWALVAAGSTVTRDVPPFALVAGAPARRIAWVGRAGHPLQPVTQGRWRCPETAQEYIERDDTLTEA